VKKNPAIWNCSRENYGHLTLKKVLILFKKAGHQPVDHGCGCCWSCEKCDDTLLDDLRLDFKIEKCKGYQIDVVCKSCGMSHIEYVKKKPVTAGD